MAKIEDKYSKKPTTAKPNPNINETNKIAGWSYIKTPA
jgi:hypothetical protein